MPWNTWKVAATTLNFENEGMKNKDYRKPIYKPGNNLKRPEYDPVHFHGSFPAFCGSEAICRRFTMSPTSVTCPACIRKQNQLAFEAEEAELYPE